MEQQKKVFSSKSSAAENLSRLIDVTTDKVKQLASASSVAGDTIYLDDCAVIPVSKVSAGFAGGYVGRMIGGQISSNRFRFSSTVLVCSRPIKVVTSPTPSLALAAMTFFRCARAAARLVRSPSMVLG